MNETPATHRALKTAPRAWRGAALAAMAALAVVAGLACWKMLVFHSRLHALENPQWERSVFQDGHVSGPIVLFGDSQIERWPVSTSFGVLPVVDRGLGGAWVRDAAARFKRDVLPLQPRVVVILIGTNDLGNKRDPLLIVNDINALAAAAKGAGSEVIVCSLLPVAGAAARIRPVEKIRGVNERLMNSATAGAWSYLDLYSVLADGSGAVLDAAYSEDGLHINQAGYIRLSQALLPLLLSRHAFGPAEAVPGS